MVVETLLGYPFPLEKSADFALEHGARVPGGTDMGVLSRALEQGSIAVANVGGDRTGHKGVFSDSGHYLVVLAEAPDGRLVLADPYLMAPYAAGVLRFTVPYADLAGIVADGFLPAEDAEENLTLGETLDEICRKLSGRLA